MVFEEVIPASIGGSWIRRARITQNPHCNQPPLKEVRTVSGIQKGDCRGDMEEERRLPQNILQCIRKKGGCAHKRIQSEQRITLTYEKRAKENVGRRSLNTSRNESHRVLHTHQHRQHIRNVTTKWTSDSKQKPDINERGIKRKREACEAPLWISGPCGSKGARQYISTCELSYKFTRETLLEEHREIKRRNVEKSRGRTAT